MLLIVRRLMLAGYVRSMLLLTEIIILSLFLLNYGHSYIAVHFIEMFLLLVFYYFRNIVIIMSPTGMITQEKFCKVILFIWIVSLEHAGTFIFINFKEGVT